MSEVEPKSSKKRSRHHSKKRHDKHKKHRHHKANDERVTPEQEVLDSQQMKDVAAGDAKIKPKTRRKVGEAAKKAHKRLNVSELGVGKDQVSFVRTLIKQVQARCEGVKKPKRQVSRETIILFDNLRNFCVELMIQAAKTNDRATKTRVFMPKTALAAIRYVSPGTLSQACIERAVDCMKRYNDSRAKDAATPCEEGKKRKSETTEKRAGLTLKVQRIRHAIRQSFPKVGMLSAIAITAAIEVLLEAQILLTIMNVEKAKPQRFNDDGEPISTLAMITPNDVMMAICSHDGKTGDYVDNGLADMFRSVVWTECGSKIPKEFSDVALGVGA
jgi:hypothetical protein